MLRSRKDRAVHKTVNVTGAKSIATSDHMKIDKHGNKDFKGNYTGHVTSAKHRVPRFSPEHTQDSYVVPTLWHKLEDKSSNLYEKKGAMSQQKGSKKATKLLNGSATRVDSQTSHLIKRNSTEKLKLNQENNYGHKVADAAKNNQPNSVLVQERVILA